MTVKLAITGKSGSGKTTIVKAFMRIFRQMFPEKSILLFDNDLAGELGHSFGLDIRNTIYGIRTGKHEYKTGIPEDMTKQEFIDNLLIEKFLIIVRGNLENLEVIFSSNWIFTDHNIVCYVKNGKCDDVELEG